MRFSAAAKATEQPALFEGHQGRGVSLFLAGVAAMVLLATFATGVQYTALAIVLGLPVGIWLVYAHPIWAVLVYITICASPFFGIYDYIEPGEYAVGGLLILLFLRECTRKGVSGELRRLAKPYWALVLMFVVSALVALSFGNSASSWMREQAQYLPIFLGPVVARSLQSRRQALFLVLASAGLTLLALPFETFHYLWLRATGYLTPEEWAGLVVGRLPLPHFSVMNAATLSALFGSWLLVSKPMGWKIVNYILAVFIPLSMFIALSRIWTFATLLALFLPPLLAPERQKRLQLLSKFLLLTLLVGLALILAYHKVEIVFPELRGVLSERLDILDSPMEDESLYVRLQGFRYLASVFASSPIWGHGLGYVVSLEAYEWAKLSASVSGFDNGHLAILIKFGMVGAIVFYWFFWHVGRRAYRTLCATRDPLAVVVCSTFVSSLVTLALLNFSYSGLNFFDNTNFIGIWSGMALWFSTKSPLGVAAGPARLAGSWETRWPSAGRTGKTGLEPTA